MNTHQYRAVEALEQMRARILEKVSTEFQGMTEEQMEENYHNDVMTNRQKLQSLKQQDKGIIESIAWVKSRTGW